MAILYEDREMIEYSRNFNTELESLIEDLENIAGNVNEDRNYLAKLQARHGPSFEIQGGRNYINDYMNMLNEIVKSF